MKEKEGVLYDNPLLEEEEEIGTDDRKSGNYVNPQAKLRETKTEEVTKITEESV
ncbi:MULTISPECIES: hypothetical protein [Eubacterium]|uniref:Uncharacterized protein n=2 Tax=Eubacterium TaxID=1730 RepID=A0A1H4AYX2_9FIRM|nr:MULTISPECIES: hypothetical protein [Eubacterium]MDD4691649.1 hypothetical protein [Eubacterium aggregans]MEA5073965.1 hypothetical protein [Eubacterium aggregans]SDY05001.1 hypothetical protein SAMN04488579_11475 [Eubacterium barkeri]SEA41101.1 hypothetical protein SAMN04515656_109105 [Eubacterium aggregans]